MYDIMQIRLRNRITRGREDNIYYNKSRLYAVIIIYRVYMLNLKVMGMKLRNILLFPSVRLVKFTT